MDGTKSRTDIVSHMTYGELNLHEFNVWKQDRQFGEKKANPVRCDGPWTEFFRGGRCMPGWPGLGYMGILK